MKKFGTGLWILLALLLVLSSCGESPSSSSEETRENLQGAGEEVKDLADNKEEPVVEVAQKDGELAPLERLYEEVRISAQEAVEIFKKEFPQASINEIKLERKSSGYQYEFEGHEGTSQYELKIDGASGEILDRDVEKDEEQRGDLRKLDLSPIDDYLEDAFEKLGPGFWLDEWELEAKRGYIKFQLEVKNSEGSRVKFKYNYESGELLN